MDVLHWMSVLCALLNMAGDGVTKLAYFKPENSLLFMLKRYAEICILSPFFLGE